MTPSQMQACAKFLGEPYYIYTLKDGTVCLNRHGPKPSDAELFYALLLKAQTSGLEPVIFWSFGIEKWEASLFDNPNDDYWNEEGPTPLDALAAAIEKLEQESGNAKD